MSSCYSCSKSINFVNVRNGFKCSAINSSLLSGQGPVAATFFLSAFLCVGSNAQLVGMWSRVYVCMYVCMYLCMYVCMFMCMYVCVCMYEGNSISKLQNLIEKNRIEIMTYKQHLFFNTISIQI